jgi:ribose 5-phosphate isomerase B
MRIALSSDMHRPLVEHLRKKLEERGHQVACYGPAAPGKEEDWPLVTALAARDVAEGRADEAIVCCWTGTGAALAANKVPGVRAALVHDPYTARGARKWNHANALALSLRTTTEALADEILDAWFDEPFTEDEWNRRQIERIREMEGRTTPTEKP